MSKVWRICASFCQHVQLLTGQSKLHFVSSCYYWFVSQVIGVFFRRFTGMLTSGLRSGSHLVGYTVTSDRPNVCDVWQCICSPHVLSVSLKISCCQSSILLSVSHVRAICRRSKEGSKNDYIVSKATRVTVQALNNHRGKKC